MIFAKPKGMLAKSPVSSPHEYNAFADSCAIIPAAGQGQRMGSQGISFCLRCRTPVLLFALKTLSNVFIQGIIFCGGEGYSEIEIWSEKPHHESKAMSRAARKDRLGASGSQRCKRYGREGRDPRRGQTLLTLPS
jgi:hypothetical protein